MSESRDACMTELLIEIRDILREIRNILKEPDYSPAPAPYIPTYPEPPVLNAPLRTCPRCGIYIDTVMGYVCQVQGCPTGLCPTTC